MVRRQILVSEIVRLLVGARGGFAFSSIGPLQLKGLPQPVTTYEVQWEPDTPAAILPLPGQLSTLRAPMGEPHHIYSTGRN